MLTRFDSDTFHVSPSGGPLKNWLQEWVFPATLIKKYTITYLSDNGNAGTYPSMLPLYGVIQLITLVLIQVLVKLMHKLGLTSTNYTIQLR